MSELLSLLGTAIYLYSFLIFIRVLLTWIPNLDPYNPLVQMLYQVTDPVLEPARRVIPPLGGMIDISPMIVLFALSILAQLLQDLARSL